MLLLWLALIYALDEFIEPVTKTTRYPIHITVGPGCLAVPTPTQLLRRLLPSSLLSERRVPRRVGARRALLRGGGGGGVQVGMVVVVRPAAVVDAMAEAEAEAGVVAEEEGSSTQARVT